MALTTEPRVNLTAVDVIQDTQRMKRLKATLCDGIFAYADEDMATWIMEESLKICGRSADTLSEVVQKMLIFDHTPFYWTLLNKPSEAAVPPLFAELILACQELLPNTQEEIMEIIRGQYDSRLYAIVKGKISVPGLSTHEPSNESFFKGDSDQPTVTVRCREETGHQHPGSFTQRVSFNIPKFFDRLIVDEEVWIQFLALDCLLRFRAAIVPPYRNHPHPPLQLEIEEVPSGSAVPRRGEWSSASVSMALCVFVPVSASRVNRLDMTFSTTLRRGSGERAILSKESRPYQSDTSTVDLLTLIRSARNLSGSLTITTS